MKHGYITKSNIGDNKKKETLLSVYLFFSNTVGPCSYNKGGVSFSLQIY